MDYRRADDQLFGKYCYIDTPWIAGKKTIYRIIRSGVRSNAWCEVPVRGRNEIVTHDRYEDIVFVVLDTLIDEDTKIKRFALKDIEIIEIADHKTEPTTKTETQNSNLTFEKAGKSQTDCNGCKFVGTYDTEFPCANCSRKTKDYYAKDEPQTEREGE